MNATTKEKILQMALKLFGEKSFKGVSVREIARECEVNIAAVNYHFKSKEDLYLEVLKSSIIQLSSDIQQIYESLPEKKVSLLSLNVFQLFINNSEKLKASFKLILSSEDFHERMSKEFPRFIGPPGGDFFNYCIKDELGEIGEDDINWGVRVIFSHLIHKALILSNGHICQSLSSVGLNEEVFKEDINRLVELVMHDLQVKS